MIMSMPVCLPRHECVFVLDRARPKMPPGRLGHLAFVSDLTLQDTVWLMSVPRTLPRKVF